MRRVDAASPTKIVVSKSFFFGFGVGAMSAVLLYVQMYIFAIYFDDFWHACGENVVRQIKQFNFQIPTIYDVIHLVHSSAQFSHAMTGPSTAQCTVVHTRMITENYKIHKNRSS